MKCPNCDGEMNCEGYDDGGGDYGDAVVEIWSCANCGYLSEGSPAIEDDTDEHA